MSIYRSQDSEQNDGEDDRPQVPEGVLRGIEDIEEGRTASKEDIKSVLKY